MTLADYHNTKTYKGQTSACLPFELTRIPVVDSVDSNAVRTYRVIVVGKHGLGREHGYDDIPVAVCERLTGKDRLDVEQWIPVPDADMWATMLACQVKRERHEFDSKMRQLGRAVHGRSTTTPEEILSAVEVVCKNLGLLLNKTGAVDRTLPTLLEVMQQLQIAVSKIGTRLQPGTRLDLADIDALLAARELAGLDPLGCDESEPEERDPRLEQLHTALHLKLIDVLPVERVDRLNIGATILQHLGGSHRQAKDRQARAARWAAECFGPEVLQDRQERVLRVLEEAAELAQAEGVGVDQARRVVDYVFSRPAGAAAQELGGVLLTCLVYAAAAGLSADEVERIELERVLAKDPADFRRRNVEKTRAGVGRHPLPEGEGDTE